MNAHDKGALTLAQRWGAMTEAGVDHAVRSRLLTPIHETRLAVELDFRARLVTALRQEHVWPPSYRRR